MVRIKVGSSLIRVVALAVMGLSSSVASNAQWETFVTCHELWIDLRPYEAWNGVIPRCMDTLIVGYTPMMRRHELSTDTVCARLYNVGHSNNQGNRIPIETVNKCNAPGMLTIIPLQPLAVTDSSGRPIWYELDMYCSYWHGPHERDTSRIRFRKATGFRAYTEAREATTGEDLTHLGLTWPPIDHSDHDVENGVQIVAMYGNGYDFVRWTTVDAELLQDVYSPRQILDSLCWPIGRPVVFTALYARTASVNNASDPPTSFTVWVFDVLGRVIRVLPQHPSNASECVRGLPRGPYIVRTNANDQQHSTTLIYKENTE